MIKTIVFLGDIHYRTFKRHNEYRAVCEAFFSHMTNNVKPDRIVLTGDIVHSRNHIFPELVEELTWFHRELSKVAEKIIIIPGNHDIVEQNLERMDVIDPVLKAIKCDNINYIKKSGLYPDDNIVWCSYNLYDHNKKPDKIELRPFGKDKTYIGLYHGMIVGSKNFAGFEFKSGKNTDDFNDCDIVLMGDIHKRQVLKSSKNVQLIYPGSMIQQDFAETITGHGYGILNVGDELTYTFKDLDNPIKLYKFHISDISDIYEEREILTNA